MKTNYTLPLIAVLVISLAIAACGAQSPTVDQKVQTVVAQTATFQGAVNQAANATVAALPPTPTPGPQVDYTTMTEEQLSALIDQSVNQALAASSQSNTATTQATSDGTITSDEVYATVAYVYDAQAEIEYAEQLMTYYLDLYGDYASAALDTMQATESDLNSIAQSLDEIAGIMEQGAEAATAALDQLNQAATQLQTKASDAQTKAQGWADQVTSSIKDRKNQALSLAPTDIAGSRNDAIKQVYSYLDSVKQALGDSKISPSELTQISQLGANAKASLHAQGGPQLQNLAGGIDGLTTQLAGGEWPQARNGLDGFEHSLPARPLKP
jgi:F0F1-type ATP synthase membrane subunit b/b'